MDDQSRPDIVAGQKAYQSLKDKWHADPEYQAIYDEEAAKSALWLQLVEARQAAGLTQAEVAKRLGVSQAQVARIEKRGYDSHSISTLRRYVKALGEGFELNITVQQLKPKKTRTSRNSEPVAKPSARVASPKDTTPRK